MLEGAKHRGQPTVPVAGLSIWISTTSPSMISVSSLLNKPTMRNPPSLRGSSEQLRSVYSLDAYPDGLPEGLAQSFRLAHL